MRRLALVVLAGCWTGPVPEPAAPTEPVVAKARPAHDLELILGRGPCFGRCPVFRLKLHGDGRVEWEPGAYTAVAEKRERRIGSAQLAAIEHALDAVRFFERDRFGKLPQQPVCTHSGNTTSCSFTSVTICSDTSHTTIDVRRGGRTHRIDNPHCSDEDDALERLEEVILDRTGVRDWIGR